MTSDLQTREHDRLIADYSTQDGFVSEHDGRRLCSYCGGEVDRGGCASALAADAHTPAEVLARLLDALADDPLAFLVLAWRVRGRADSLAAISGRLASVMRDAAFVRNGCADSRSHELTRAAVYERTVKLREAYPDLAPLISPQSFNASDIRVNFREGK